MTHKGTQHAKKATVFGIGAFFVITVGLWILTKDAIFSTVIGFVFGIGAFDLTVVLSNPDSGR